MIEVVKIASYICQRYQKDFGVSIDEMKLHKMLYFTQREAIVQTGEPLFSSSFEAWKYGPVLVEIRQLYKNGMLNTSLSEPELNQCKPILDKVFMLYAKKDSWSLSSITHGEYSWKKARIGLSMEENGTSAMQVEDIKKDAERIKLRRFILDKIKNVSILNP